jgi:uncharacterized phage protein gp47/JayE
VPLEYGLTEYGFYKKNFPAIKLEIESSLQDAFGAVNLDDQSNFGQIVGIFTEREALLWEALESVYNSMYPDTASGFSLDSVCALTGLTRLQATSTKLVCQLTGTNNTLIVADSQVGAENISTSFLLESDVALSNTRFIEISLGIDDTELDSYTLNLNNIDITYTPSSDNSIEVEADVDQDGIYEVQEDIDVVDGGSDQEDIDIDGDGSDDLEVNINAAVDGLIDIAAEGIQDGVNYLFGVDVDGDGVDDVEIAAEDGEANVVNANENVGDIDINEDVDGNLDISIETNEQYIILNGLATEINANFTSLEAEVRDDALIISSIEGLSFNQVFISDGIIINSVTDNGLFIANEKGSIQAPANAINIIETPVSGWLSVNNRESGDTGRNIETDIELRIRRNESLRLSGSGTVEALRSRLLNLDGVITASITENTSDVQVGDLPPHCFEALVGGGADQDIGSVLWNYKPAGILAYGDIDVVVDDSTGTQQVVSYSRPTTLYVYITINITKDATDDYPADAVNVIQEAIVEQINQLNIGDDVIYQSLYKSVYLVDGIESATILIGGTLDESTIPALTSSNIDVTSSQIAVTDVTKITINEV